jgi:hypothetical protein
MPGREPPGSAKSCGEHATYHPACVGSVLCFGAVNTKKAQ